MVKIENGEIVFDGIHTKNELERLARVELEELQKIEEELGIDLITLFEALKNGFYWKDGNYIHFIKSDYIKLCFDSYEETVLEIKIEYVYIVCSLKDYGKTWALSKEELC